MRWQIPVIILILVWNIGSLIWIRRADPAERDSRAKANARITFVVAMVMFVIALTLLF